MEKGGHCEVQLQEDRLQVRSTHTDPRKIRKKPDALSYLAVMEPFFRAARDIQAAHDKKRSQIPLLGVNLEIWRSG